MKIVRSPDGHTHTHTDTHVSRKRYAGGHVRAQVRGPRQREASQMRARRRWNFEVRASRDLEFRL